jgi:hypothetical protein
MKPTERAKVLGRVGIITSLESGSLRAGDMARHSRRHLPIRGVGECRLFRFGV